MLVRNQVHAEDHETILEFEDADNDNSDEEKENGDDFFDIEEKNAGDGKAVKEDSTVEAAAPVENGTLKLSASAAEWVPQAKSWSTFENSDMKWIKNDQVFNQPESRYEVKTVDIAGNYWEYNAEKSFYQMLLGGVDYLLLGVLLNNEYVINKEEYDLVEVHTKVISVSSGICTPVVLYCINSTFMSRFWRPKIPLMPR